MRTALACCFALVAACGSDASTDVDAGDVDGANLDASTAPPAPIDPDFGTDGMTWWQSGGRIALDAIAIAPGGKIHVAGFTASPDVATLACRLTVAGSPDPTWAGDGCFDGPGAFVKAATMTSGGLVLAGGTTVATAWRLRDDGTLDPGFGSGGAAPLTTTSSGARAVAVDGDAVMVASSIGGNVVLTRLGANGAVLAQGQTADLPGPQQLIRKADATWLAVTDSVYAVPADLSTFTPVTVPGVGLTRRVLALPDGALLVLENGGVHRIHRQLASGSTDPGFGAGGSVVPPPGPRAERWHAMATLPDGRIIVVGHRAHTGPYQAALRVYSATGVLDTSIGDAGVLLWPSLDIGAPLPLEMTLNAVAIAADGSIIVAGGEQATNPTRAFVSRVLPL